MARKPPFSYLLQTDERLDGAPLPYRASSREDRSDRRHIVDCAASLHLPTRRIAIQVHELSQSGLTLSGLCDIYPGERCLIALPGLAIRAVDLIWRREDKGGACFADLLSRACLNRLLLRYEIPEG